MSATLRAPGSHGAPATLAASGIAPGDTVEQVMTLRNTGSAAWTQVALTTAASPSSLLDTDVRSGLQVRIDRCSVPWTEQGASPRRRYACRGTRSVVLAPGPAIRTRARLAGLHAAVPGASDQLRVATSLPRRAGNQFQGLSSTIELTLQTS